MSIANKIMNFIKDERGAEGAEYPIIALVTAGGSVVAIKGLNAATKQGTENLTDKITTEVNPT
jgi:Flp pilus assembly pilin Flp